MSGVSIVTSKKKKEKNMYCANCGKEIEDTTAFCPYCGKATAGGENIALSDVAKYTEQQAKKAVGSIQSSAKNFHEAYRTEQEARKIQNVREIFVSPNEEKRAVIGGGYLANMLRTGSIGKGFGILTDKRFYFKGKCYYKAGKHFMQTDEERTVDLQDITSSGYVYTRYVLWELIALLFLGLVILIATTTEDPAVLSVGVFLDIIPWAVYIFYKRAIYEVSFAGGSIGIKASSYGIREIKAFDKQLRLAKDECVAMSFQQEKTL